MIRNPLGKQTCTDLYNSYVHYARTVPGDRAISWFEMEDCVYWLASDIPFLDEQVW